MELVFRDRIRTPLSQEAEGVERLPRQVHGSALAQQLTGVRIDEKLAESQFHAADDLVSCNFLGSSSRLYRTEQLILHRAP